MFLFVFLLSACDNLVEERTLTCSNSRYDEEFTVVYQENRIISLSDNIGNEYTRTSNLAYLLDLEEGLYEDYETDSLFEALDEYQNIENEEVTCSQSTAKVEFVEDEETNLNSAEVQLEKELILYDALQIENAAKLYCSQSLCDADQELTWGDLSPYITGFDEDYYETSNETVLARKSNGKWHIYLEAVGTGNWELPPGLIPSESTYQDVIEDTN